MSASFADRLVARGAGLTTAPLPPAAPPWSESSEEAVAEIDVAPPAPATVSQERPALTTAASGTQTSPQRTDGAPAPAPGALEVTSAAPAPAPPAPAPITASAALVRRARAQGPAPAPVSTSPPYAPPAPAPPSADPYEPRGSAATSLPLAPETRQAAQPDEGLAERSEVPAASPGTIERVFERVVPAPAPAPDAVTGSAALPPSPRVDEHGQRPDPALPVRQASELPPEPVSVARARETRAIAKPAPTAPGARTPEHSGPIGAGDHLPAPAVRIGTIEVRVESLPASAAAAAPASAATVATPATVGFADYLATRSYAR
jgi:hypothetical protein